MVRVAMTPPSSDVHTAAPPRAHGFALAACVAVLLGGGLAHRWIDRVLEAPGTSPVVLDRPLSTLPMRLGPWEGADVPLSKRVIEVAGSDDHVYRRYFNTLTGEVVDLYVAYAARPARMLGHRPQVCFPAQGWAAAGHHPDEVPLPSGGSLPCLMHRFTRGGPGGESVVMLNYYNLAGRHVTDWTEFWGPRWRLPNLARDPRYFVAQVQISTVASDVDPPGQAEERIRRFAAEAVPGISAFWPDDTREAGGD